MDRRNFIKALAASGLVSAFPLNPARAAQEALPESMTNEGRPSGKPFDLTILPDGNLALSYVSLSPPDYKVLITNTRGEILNSFGAAGAKEGLFNFPRGITSDSKGNILVVDSNNCRVQGFTGDGKLLGVLGAVGSIGGAFATPQGVSLDDQGGVIVADTRNHRIQIFRDNQLEAVIGELGDKEDQFRLPTAAVADPMGRILVLDSKHGQVKVFSKDYKFLSAFSRQGSEPGALNLPQGMTLDSQGNVWIADTGNKRVQVFGSNGDFLGELKDRTTKAPVFDQPTGIIAQDNMVMAADYGSGRIMSFSLT